MTWNYRLILHDNEQDLESKWIGLHEVFYENGQIRGWTECPISFVADEEEKEDGIINALEMALKNAKELPMLIETELIKNIKEKE